jgi:extracellular factor (EF) 3-hydroxypalmitic acid methyl ester biosynthesis protein
VSDDEIAGVLEREDGELPVRVVKTTPHALYVKFPEAAPPDSRASFTRLRLKFESGELTLGRCRYFAHAEHGSRRASDPPAVGDGRVVFLETLYDFSSLNRAHSVLELNHRLEQLPVLWSRKENLHPAFREFTADMIYDLQVYRSVFDEIDRNLSEEPPGVRAVVQGVVADAEYGNFCTLFDGKLKELESVVHGFTVEQHERHGFYLRKHAWDIIYASEFMRRTNLKPRGYAGDSMMMRMLYENKFQGWTIFSRFVHRHPVQSAAAQAVRNRLTLLSAAMTRIANERGAKVTRVMSVAAGPAWELREVLRDRSDFARFEFSLLDQDPEALSEAKAMVTGLEQQHGATANISYIKESVRTMMRSRDLEKRWGRFSFLYSMGLFDYLTAPVAKVVLRRLYDLLEPGGELLVGNFHVSNPTRLYMEYLMDWVLTYRDENQMLELASSFEGAKVDVVFEATHSQMFLRVRKEG